MLHMESRLHTEYSDNRRYPESSQKYCEGNGLAVPIKLKDCGSEFLEQVRTQNAVVGKQTF